MKQNFTYTLCALGLLAFLTSASFAQELKLINGLYLDQDNRPYTGEYTSYYPSGERSALFHLQEGELNNAAFFYRENGTLEASGFFHHGKRDGHWQSFDERGNKLSSVHFNRGTKVGEWEIRVPHTQERYLLYYSQGNLIDARKAETFALGR